MQAIDCMGFAGGMTLGIVQAGFDLAGKREDTGGFGVPMCEGNRHLLKGDWVTQEGRKNWTPIPGIDLVFGNPPCSGFSSLTDKKTNRGAINECMRHFVEFAGLSAPRAVVMESVQQAYTKGRPWMVELRAILEEVSGRKYTLTHVLHSAGACGASSLRKRYFLVCTRDDQPLFGVLNRWVKGPKTLPVLKELIGDLEGKVIGWGPFKGIAPGLAAPNGHMVIKNSGAIRLGELAKVVDWPQGRTLEWFMTKLVDDGKDQLLYDVGFTRTRVLTAVLNRTITGPSPYDSLRLSFDRICPVVHGHSCHLWLHPTEHRTLTFREVARLQGFPDAWNVNMVREDPKGPFWFGKGVTVQAARWIGDSLYWSLEGKSERSAHYGTEVGEREYLIDVTNKYVIPQRHKDSLAAARLLEEEADA